MTTDLLSAALIALGVLALVLRAVSRAVERADIGRRWGGELEDTYFEGWRER